MHNIYYCNTIENEFETKYKYFIIKSNCQLSPIFSIYTSHLTVKSFEEIPQYKLFDLLPSSLLLIDINIMFGPEYANPKKYEINNIVVILI